MIKTLLLDRNYQPIAFISFRKCVRFLVKDKVEVVSTWDDERYVLGNPYPSVVRLKGYLRKGLNAPRFNRRGVFRRDGFKCQYTGVHLPTYKLTVDHIIPKSQGGKSTWENCVTCSIEINSLKGDRTPEQVGLKLIRKPFVPNHPVVYEYMFTRPAHPDWAMYFPELKTERDSPAYLDAG